MYGEQQPLTDEQQRQVMDAAQREWDEKWAPAFDAAVEDGSLEAARDRDQTRSVLRRASDELVDMTVQTPWQRQHEQDVEDDDDTQEPMTFLGQLRQSRPVSHLASFKHDKDRMR